ncbi:hypothetical protein XENOCAPTIV_024573 [Xenoophorus captivus]|uniref:Uncharacterized protein n=1 Tax=Xenoophorus captivus TaxID=1517983 RepID=A0ABV0R1W4_9TELE
MECNDAKTQCTIGLARRPCQELPGWTELCRSHYDNEYNTYAHEVVWRKTEGVWRRSFGGGLTCAEIVLGHNLRHRKSIMDVIVPFIPDSVVAPAELYAFRQHLCTETWKNCGEGAYQHACTWYETLGHSIGNPNPLQPLIIMSTNFTNISESVQVSTVEFYALLCGWFCYCHTGAWTVSQPLRFLVALQGYAKLLFGHFWVHRWEVALSLFASYLLGRVKIDWRRSLMVLLWLGVDTTALALEILLSGPHATRRAPAKIATAVMEALLAFAVIAYLRQLTLSLKGQGKWIWLSKLVGLAVWSLGWGVLSVLYWLQLTTDLPIMVWLMTYAAFFHYSPASPDAPSCDTQPPPIRSPWLAAQRRNREIV